MNVSIWIATYASPFAMRCTILLWGLRLTLFAVAAAWWLLSAWVASSVEVSCSGVKPSSAVGLFGSTRDLRAPSPRWPSFQRSRRHDFDRLCAAQVAWTTQRFSYMGKPGKPTEAELSILGVLCGSADQARSGRSVMRSMLQRRHQRRLDDDEAVLKPMQIMNR